MICVSYFDRLDKESKKHKVYTSNVGTRFEKTYEYRVIDGIDSLVPNGETDLQAEIDSYAESADINNVIARFLNGDSSVLNQTVGTFGDFRDCPTTYAEMFDRVKMCENVFDSLPVDIRDKFDNSYKKFWSSMGSEYFDNVFAEFNDSSVPEKTDPVVESEVIPDAK